MDARTPASSRPALVLGGGGALGVIQAAYITAALEMGFRPELIVGTSVGSLNGAWAALHPDRPEELLKIWLGLDRLALVRFQPMRLVGKLFHPTSVTTNDIVPRLLRRYLPGARFEDSAIELAVTATNLSRGEKHVFTEGSLEQAILASTAIPGVFEPVAIGGELFVDGCVTASVDLATAAEMGATEILAIDLTPLPAPARPKTAAGVLKQSFSILTSATTRAAETCLARQMPVRVIRPDLSHNSPWRLDDSAGSIARNLRLAADGLRGVFDSDGHIAPDGKCWAIPPAASHTQEGVSPSRFFGAARKAS